MPTYSSVPPSHARFPEVAVEFPLGDWESRFAAKALRAQTRLALEQAGHPSESLEYLAASKWFQDDAMRDDLLRLTREWVNVDIVESELGSVRLGCDSALHDDQRVRSVTAPARVALAVAVLVVVFGGLVVLLTGLESWRDDRPRFGDEDFVWGFSVPNAETAHEVLLTYKMTDDDAACAVESIFTPDLEFDPWYGDLYTVDAAMLDAAIEVCDIDTNRITMPWAD